MRPRSVRVQIGRWILNTTAQSVARPAPVHLAYRSYILSACGFCSDSPNRPTNHQAASSGFVPLASPHTLGDLIFHIAEPFMDSTRPMRLVGIVFATITAFAVIGTLLAVSLGTNLDSVGYFVLIPLLLTTSLIAEILN